MTCKSPSIKLLVSVLALSSALMVGCEDDPVPSLKLFSVNPIMVQSTGGATIALQGTAFTPDMNVSIDGQVCGSLEVESETIARCVVPDHKVGSATVRVESADDEETAELRNGLTYTCAAPPADGIAIWANDGGDKVTRDEQRATCDAMHLRNRNWDGTTISVFGAKNEVVAFNAIIEASAAALSNVEVSLSALTGPRNYRITSVPATGDGVFDWTQRNVELFYVRYLEIKGLSLLGYSTYDERHIPKRLRRPWTGTGTTNSDGKANDGTTWLDRPDHNKFYPDIAVPLEVVGDFNIAAQENQSIWTDIYIPKAAPAGLYNGTFTVKVNGLTRNVPVQLEVKKFELPDEPNSKTMLFLGYEDVARRYVGGDGVPDDDPVLGPKVDLINDRHFQMAHRHKMAMVDSNRGYTIWTQKRPRPSWDKRLNGNLFKPEYGYNGPGVGKGNGIFSIGTYGSWDWQTSTDSQTAKEAMWANTDAWQSWFNSNFPNTERFLYLIDESINYPQTQMWARWMDENPGIGSTLPSFATVPLDATYSIIPNLDVFSSQIRVENTAAWDTTFADLKTDGKKFYAYNGFRPASGTFMIEDDGVALRQLAWGQYKKEIDRWFYWQTTYYLDYQNARGETNVFRTAQTFGGQATPHDVLGMAAVNYGNGDGVLFYPGTDTVYPDDSYGLEGPIASLRLKHWRRGIQDIDYIVRARLIDSERVDEIIEEMNPKILWEVGSLPGNYVHTDIKWSIDPDAWEAAREELADIIESAMP